MKPHKLKKEKRREETRRTVSGSVPVLIESRLFTFAFNACASGVISKKSLSRQMSRSFFCKENFEMLEGSRALSGFPTRGRAWSLIDCSVFPTCADRSSESFPANHSSPLLPIHGS